MKVIGNLRFLSLDELSSFLGLSKVTLRSYIKTGKLDGRKIGQRWFITEQSVSKLVKGTEYDYQPLEYSDNSAEPATNRAIAGMSNSILHTDLGMAATKTKPIDFFSFISSKVNLNPAATGEDEMLCEIWLDPKGMITYYSPMIELSSECSPDEIAKNPNLIIELIHPADREWVSKAFAESIVNKTTSELYYRIVSKYGKIHWIKHSSKPVFLPDGRYLGRQVLLRNVTDEKLAEATLAEIWPNVDFNIIVNAPIIMFNEARTIIRMYNITPLLSDLIFDRKIQLGDIIDASNAYQNVVKIAKCLDNLETQKKYQTKLVIAYNPRIEVNCYAFRMEMPPASRHLVIVLI